MTNKLVKTTLVGLVGLAGLVLIERDLSKEYKIKPEAFADANGDGIDDALVTSQKNVVLLRPLISYFDGRNIRKDENGNYFVKRNPIPILGTTLSDKSVYIGERFMVVGQFDNDPLLDIKVVYPTANPL